MKLTSDPTPPRFARWFLHRCAENLETQSLIDDLEEEYARFVSENGDRKANRWYRLHVLRALPRVFSYPFLLKLSIARNTLKITLRRFQTQKAFTSINISGLAVGIACTVLILLWIQDELSFNRFHEKSDRLYRVNFKTEDDLYRGEYLPGPAADYMKQTYPEIIMASVIRSTNVKLTVGERSFSSTGNFVHQDFLEMFSFPLIEGNPKGAFFGPPSFLITEELAERLFGDENPMGKTIMVNDRVPFAVTGVMKNIPENSSIRFDFLMNFAFAPEWARIWDNKACETFVLLHEDASSEEVDQKIVDVYNDHNPGTYKNNFYLQPFKEIYLHGLQRTPRIVYVYILTAVAGIILLMACVNFMNMATARAEQRMKEIGLRKVAGVTRGQLIRQFLLESFILCVLAAFLALALVSCFISPVNAIAGKQLALRLTLANGLLLIGIITVTGFLAGIYPAFFLSSFHPIEVIRGQIPGSKHRVRKGGIASIFPRGSAFRNILVIVQFSFTICFIVCILAVTQQMQFVRKKDLGYDVDHVIQVRLQGTTMRQIQSIKSTLQEYPDIEGVTVSSYGLDGWNASSGIDWEGKDTDTVFDVGFNWVDHDYLSTLKLKLVAGRFFSKSFPSDLQDAFVVNEATVRAMEIDNPVGKRITRAPGSSFEHSGTIIGVVKDYHTESLHREIRPFILLLREIEGNMLIRIHPDDVPGTLEYIKGKIAAFSPSDPFIYRFLDERIDDLYSMESLTGEILRFITLLAVFISCLGLFGLASYSIERRTKEIGIRKVVGASFQAIFVKVMKDFIVWVLLANLIAWPVSWFIVNSWLQRFAFQTPIHVGMFFLAGVLALTIAFLTIFYQTVRAARMKAVDSLRYE